jgi:hypothetical protein
MPRIGVQLRGSGHRRRLCGASWRTSLEKLSFPAFFVLPDRRMERWRWSNRSNTTGHEQATRRTAFSMPRRSRGVWQGAEGERVDVRWPSQSGRGPPLRTCRSSRPGQAQIRPVRRNRGSTRRGPDLRMQDLSTSVRLVKKPKSISSRLCQAANLLICPLNVPRFG